MLVVLLAPVVTKVPAGGPPASRANSGSAAARPAAAEVQPREKGVTMRRDTSAELLLIWGVHVAGVWDIERRGGFWVAGRVAVCQQVSIRASEVLWCGRMRCRREKEKGYH